MAARRPAAPGMPTAGDSSRWGGRPWRPRPCLRKERGGRMGPGQVLPATRTTKVGGPRARCRYPHGPTLTSLSVRRDPGPLRAPAQVTLCHVALEDKAGSLDPSGAGALCDTCASSPPPRPAPAGREPDPISFLGRGGLLGSPFSLLCPTGHRGSRVSPREALSVTQAPPFQALTSQVSAAPRAQSHPARVPSSTVPVPSRQAGSGAGLVSNPSPGLPGQMPRPGALATHASVSPSIQRDS